MFRIRSNSHLPLLEQAGQLLAGMSPGIDRLASLGFDPLKRLDNEVDGPDHAVQGDVASIPTPGETRASPSVTTQVDLDALTVLPLAINPNIKSAAAGTADERPAAGQQLRRSRQPRCRTRRRALPL